MPLREALKKILQQEDELTEIVQLVGKDSLSEDQKAILRVSFLLTKAVFRLLKSSRTSSCNRTHSLSSILTAQCTRLWA
jgi:vacuolar-type H+-ATPase catalytic subunit A/Vma1